MQSEILAKFEEGRNLRRSGFQVPKFQFEFTFNDTGVILDATYLLLSYIDRHSHSFAADPQKVMTFIKDFVPTFFGMDRETFHAYMNELASVNSPEEGDEESPAVDDDQARASHQRLEFLREVLVRGEGEGGAGEGGAEKASGPPPAADEKEKEKNQDQPTQQTGDAVLVPSTPVPDPTVPVDATELKWLEHPDQGNFNMQREYTLNAPYDKDVHHLYANLTVYCFFRAFEILYSRLLRVKLNEESAHETVRRALLNKPARELGLLDKLPSDLLYDCDPKANLYEQIVRMCDEVIKGDMEPAHLEETLRRFWLRSGYQLYNLEKMFAGITKFTGTIFDSKDKSSDIVNMFFKEREREQTSHSQEIQYRRQVEKLAKDGDIYRITFVSFPGVLILPKKKKKKKKAQKANEQLFFFAEPEHEEDHYSAYDCGGQHS